jgi:RND superfamily putative drug exporter
VVLGFLIVAGPLGMLAGKTAEVQENDNAAYLPQTAEATWVQDRVAAFSGTEATPAVIVYARSGGLTPADLAEIAGDLEAINDRFGARMARPPVGPVLAPDGEAAQVLLQFAGSDADQISGEVEWIRATVADTAGLAAHVTGPGGVLADVIDAFSGINGVLVAVTGAVILVILILVYRSPILPFVVLGVAGVALGMTNGLVYLLAKHDVITVSGQTQGILDVLVLGAGTDYALLIVARYREELRRVASRFDAMKVAWRASVEPILASGGTVIVGLLCLVLSDLAGNRGLGPVTALGITCALAAMLILLPSVLVLLGRAAFWPLRPKYHSQPAVGSGLWPWIAGVVGRWPRWVWAVTLLLLALASTGLVRLDPTGIPQTDAFLTNVDSKAGQKLLGQHFPAGSGSPAVILAKADALPAVVSAASGVPGIAEVTPFPSAEAPPTVVDGLVRIDATLVAAPDSTEASDTIRRLREAVHQVDGADARVGGYTAVNYDVQLTSQRDRNVIIPLVLAVVFVILVLLLRALVAPLLLVATVVVSFLATLGVSGVVFRDLLGYPTQDSSFPLYAFVFLVALGVDYNIFLMTRVREEVGRIGHRAGTLTGLAVTGGVITSAGVVLAATFAALAVLPLMFLVQLAFTVSFGVLLDTLIVRSLLVPALTVDLGPRVWWPGALRAAKP